MHRACTRTASPTAGRLSCCDSCSCWYQWLDFTSPMTPRPYSSLPRSPSQCQRSSLTACVPRLAACRASNLRKGHVATAEQLEARGLSCGMRSRCLAPGSACCCSDAVREVELIELWTHNRHIGSTLHETQACLHTHVKRSAHRFTASGRKTKLIHWISDERRSLGADKFSCADTQQCQCASSQAAAFLPIDTSQRCYASGSTDLSTMSNSCVQCYGRKSRCPCVRHALLYTLRACSH